MHAVTLNVVLLSLIRAVHHSQGLSIHCNTMLGLYCLYPPSLPLSHFAAVLLLTVRQAVSVSSKRGFS